MTLPPLRYTLCFLTRGDDVLMLHRHKAPNKGLWNGVGGRIEPNEHPLTGCLREVREETGFVVSTARFAGLLTWSGFEVEDGGLYLFVADAPSGEPQPCPEGILAWKPRSWLFTSPEVVSNIHRFGPLLFNGTTPQLYQFVYAQGAIQDWSIAPLPEDFQL